jgi:hypothetical protein
MELKEELESLQNRLAQIDLLTRPSSRPSSGFTELLLVKLQDLKIKIYQERGHALPHVHIDYGKTHHIASFSISPAERIEGSLSKKYDKNNCLDFCEARRNPQNLERNATRQ